MIVIENRINLMCRLGDYFREMNDDLQEAIALAQRNNAWFTIDYVKFAIHNIEHYFLQKDLLNNWVENYPSIKNATLTPKTVGLVMAGNIPLVGFHDFLSVFISGHQLRIKLSSKDTSLWMHIFAKLKEWNVTFENSVSVEPMLKGCDAYIATGSDNSARYFEYYFQKYAHIIRKNRSSVAVLTGNETEQDLEHLADDINLFYGLGCRNVTQIYTPKNFNFEPLLAAMNKYESHIDHNKFKNNYDYQLALYLLNKQYYMSNGHLLFVEADTIFAPISVVYYQAYDDQNELLKTLVADDKVQCVSTNVQFDDNKVVSFGANQTPSLTDYADGVDTMEFLSKL